MTCGVHTQATYGTWKSPITSDLLTRNSATIHEVAVRSNTTVYTITHPHNRGRTTLEYRKFDSPSQAHICEAITDSVRSCVHEYGGGAFSILADGRAVYAYQRDRTFGVDVVDMTSQSISNLVESTSCKRYADFGAHPFLSLPVLAVEEEHTATAVINRLVCIHEQQVYKVHEGNDFYAYPRFSSDGRFIAWVTWDHPSMPFWASKLWVAAIQSLNPITISTPVLVAGGKDVVAQQPVWVPGSATLLFTRNGQASDIYEVDVTAKNEECCISRAVPSGGDVEGDRETVQVQPPLWNLNASSLVALNQQWTVYVETQSGKDTLVLIDRKERKRIPLHSSYTQFSQLRAANDDQFVCIASSPTSQPALILCRLIPNDTGSYTIDIEILRASSDPLISEDFISVPEPITFPTQLPDGSSATSHALFYAPKNPGYVGPAGSLPPCRMIVHGGPTACASSSLDLAIQYWTTRGWAVCAVNFGGSTGHGLEYMRRLQGHWGDVDVRDCVAAAAYLGGVNPPWDLPMSKEFELKECNGEDGSRSITVMRREPPSYLMETILASVIGSGVFFFTRLLLSWLSWPASCAWALGLLGVIWVVVHRIVLRVQAESIRVMPHLAVQLETHRGIWTGARSQPFMEISCEREFIPRDTILDFFMMEGIQTFRVWDYAVLATSSETKNHSLKILFPNLMPSRSLYIHVYQRLHDMLLHNEPSKYHARVDASRICLHGRSSGGLTVLCALVRYPSVFCAGASWYGISHLKEMAEYTHKFEQHYTSSLMGGPPNAIPDVYYQRSALFHADQIRTPVLLLQGGQDKVVPKQQSQQMARAIEAQGGRVRYVEYENEGHGFRQAETRQAALETEFAWFSSALRNTNVQLRSCP
ncbi:Uncharacterized protein MSYG_0583 [Malassezia sympodialis ATCC 42132]|uniref:Uncharacterized protein n=1 Tax=Malassezia sympodialis (strain ATCC 42132) TaxID=1230383 RepID=A0A1M8A1D1_MALS4|nr:Uncharacterized protein MSYG_0583 [Malassezia sympodialis ATCC 42132]